MRSLEWAAMRDSSRISRCSSALGTPAPPVGSCSAKRAIHSAAVICASASAMLFSPMALRRPPPVRSGPTDADADLLVYRLPGEWIVRDVIERPDCGSAAGGRSPERPVAEAVLQADNLGVHTLRQLRHAAGLAVRRLDHDFVTVANPEPTRRSVVDDQRIGGLERHQKLVVL